MKPPNLATRPRSRPAAVAIGLAAFSGHARSAQDPSPRLTTNRPPTSASRGRASPSSWPSATSARWSEVAVKPGDAVERGRPADASGRHDRSRPALSELQGRGRRRRPRRDGPPAGRPCRACGRSGRRRSATKGAATSSSSKRPDSTASSPSCRSTRRSGKALAAEARVQQLQVQHRSESASAPRPRA